MRTLGILLGLTLVGMSATPARASFNFIHHHSSSQIIRNTAMVTTTTQAGAYTGGNQQWSGVDIQKASADDVRNTGTNSLLTGNAIATSTSRLLVNTSLGCGCTNTHVNRYSESNFAMVKTTTLAEADTGMNTQQGGITVNKARVDDVSSANTNHLTSGDATATGTSLTLINVQWNGGML